MPPPLFQFFQAERVQVPSPLEEFFAGPQRHSDYWPPSEG